MPAKRKTKVKNPQKVKKVQRRTTNPWHKLIFWGILLLISFCLFSIFHNQKHNIGYKPAANVSLRTTLYTPRPKFTPVISAYPKVTITITPTPAPLTGFCLHVPILTYHHIQPEAAAKELGQTSLTVDNGIFDQQMAYLAGNGYTPILANELINALLGHSQLPGKPVMVTMDDGYVDNATYALPVLQKYNIKANLMLASGLVGVNSDMLTWDQVNQ